MLGRWRERGTWLRLEEEVPRGGGGDACLGKEVGVRLRKALQGAGLFCAAVPGLCGLTEDDKQGLDEGLGCRCRCRRLAPRREAAPRPLPPPLAAVV